MTTKIYTLTDPNTDQVRYVGKSNNPVKRYYKHYRYNEKKTHKNNWINKLIRENKKPILHVIDEVKIEEWVFWETYWILQFKAWGFRLVNDTNGGDGSTFSNKTSFKKGISAWNKGIPLSDDAKENLRKLNTGKRQSEETIEKRRKKLKGRKDVDINLLLKNGKKTRFKKGLIPWNKSKTGHKLGGKKTARKVIQLDLNNNILKEHDSVSDAASYINVSREAIRKCCIGKNKKSGGFKWKYKQHN